MEPLMHFTLPLLILLVAFPRIDKRLIIGLAFLTFVPDFDFFIGYNHRFLFHNIFFVIILSSAIYLFSRNIKLFWISFYYLISHLIMDMTAGKVALFWPFYQRLIEIIITLNSKWKFVFDINTYPLKSVEEHMVQYPSYLFTQEGIFVILFFLIMLVIAYRIEIRKFLKR